MRERDVLVGQHVERIHVLEQTLAQRDLVSLSLSLSLSLSDCVRGFWRWRVRACVGVCKPGVWVYVYLVWGCTGGGGEGTT